MSSNQKTEPAKQTSRQGSVPRFHFVFKKENYQILVIGLVFIIIGFILMTGGGSDDPNVFDRSIFSFRRITLAPIFVLTGYIIGVYAIMKKPKTN